MQELRNQHKIVARYMALGATIKEICDSYGLSYSTWSRVVSEPLFREELARVQNELEERMLEDAVRDPTLVALKTNSKKAVDLLVVEMNNTSSEEGASAATRINAAKSILDRAGYASSPTVQANNTIVFHLSKEKLEMVHGKIEAPGEQPASVEG